MNSFIASGIKSQVNKRVQPANRTIHKLLLFAGIASSLLYVLMNILCPLLYVGYDSVSQTVSELSAIDAPTRPIWVPLGLAYTLLLVAFGLGVWRSSAENRSLRIVGALFAIHGFIGLFWPPMHQREVLAAGGGTMTDTMHILFAMVTVPLMALEIGFGAAAFGKRFRIYSIISLAILMVFGILTGLDGPAIGKNLPTPFIGIWERINIGVFLLWVVVLGIVVLRMEERFVNK
ncbi:MAG TPA: DUF998 domain-containing protein [Parafilimonas sp.]|nr:DUF998 domain-containing protein [Parafilimonas sp.]